MERDDLHDGRSDGLRPLQSLNLADVQSFPDLLRAMSETAFSGRQLGEAFDVLLEMSKSPQCNVVMTLTGAMTVAKQGRIICDLIEQGVINCIVATGALIAHGLTESIGLTHYRYDPSQSDVDLFEKGYNRIYDTLEMEANLNDVERLVRSVLNDVTPEQGVWSSARLCRELGRRLSETDAGVGILRSAYEKNVPVFIPAFTDSEMGLDVSTWAMKADCVKKGIDPTTITAEELFTTTAHFNPFLDLQEYTRFITGSQELGIFTIGGGVPRNWAQQVGPYIDITNHRLGTQLEAVRFRYGVRICPEPVHWGGLSGCTYSEGISWGKFLPPAEGGRYAEVYTDATVGLPILCRALLEELSQN